MNSREKKASFILALCGVLLCVVFLAGACKDGGTLIIPDDNGAAGGGGFGGLPGTVAVASGGEDDDGGGGYYSGWIDYEYRGSYEGTLINMDSYDVDSGPFTVGSGSIRGASITLSGVETWGGSTSEVGSWDYLYQGSDKIGVIFTYDNADEAWMYLGKSVAANAGVNTRWGGGSFTASDMSDTYRGTFQRE